MMQLNPTSPMSISTRDYDTQHLLNNLLSTSLDPQLTPPTISSSSSSSALPSHHSILPSHLHHHYHHQHTFIHPSQPLPSSSTTASINTANASSTASTSALVQAPV